MKSHGPHTGPVNRINRNTAHSIAAAMRRRFGAHRHGWRVKDLLRMKPETVERRLNVQKIRSRFWHRMF